MIGFRPILSESHPNRMSVGVAISRDRKSTRLNSSHGYISYAVFCLKKKKPQAIGISIKGRDVRRCSGISLQLPAVTSCRAAVITEVRSLRAIAAWTGHNRHLPRALD